MSNLAYMAGPTMARKGGRLHCLALMMALLYHSVGVIASSLAHLCNQRTGRRYSVPLQEQAFATRSSNKRRSA